MLFGVTFAFDVALPPVSFLGLPERELLLLVAVTAFRFARFGAGFGAEGLLARFAEFFRAPPAFLGLPALLSPRLAAVERRLPVNEVMKSLWGYRAFAGGDRLLRVRRLLLRVLMLRPGLRAFPRDPGPVLRTLDPLIRELPRLFRSQGSQSPPF